MTICARCHLPLEWFEPDPAVFPDWEGFWTNRPALGQRCSGDPQNPGSTESDVHFADHLPMEEEEEMAVIVKDVVAMLVELS